MWTGQGAGEERGISNIIVRIYSKINSRLEYHTILDFIIYHISFTLYTLYSVLLWCILYGELVEATVLVDPSDTIKSYVSFRLFSIQFML